VDYGVMCARYEIASDLLSKRWTCQMIRVLMDGKKRFSEFKTQMPTVSDRLLSERLRDLEEQGVIERRVHNTKPVLIEYSLTGKGLALEPVVESIQNWADIWFE
jgi:DNA-binding HxlR family transcriptional regulator